MYNYEKFHSVGGLTLKPKIYIDGKDGTTGLQIYDRLSARSDIDLLLIDESKRKDPAERKKLLNAADLVFLCLPDAAAARPPRETTCAPSCWSWCRAKAACCRWSLRMYRP